MRIDLERKVIEHATIINDDICNDDYEEPADQSPTKKFKPATEDQDQDIMLAEEEASLLEDEKLKID
jgi:hypothetical protein